MKTILIFFAGSICLCNAKAQNLPKCNTEISFNGYIPEKMTDKSLVILEGDIVTDNSESPIILANVVRTTGSGSLSGAGSIRTITDCAEGSARRGGYTDTVSGINKASIKSYLCISGIYPNPAADMINVSLRLEEDANCTFRIFNMHGQQTGETRSIFFKSGGYVHSIPVQGMAQGVYFVDVETNNNHQRFKFAKQ